MKISHFINKRKEEQQWFFQNGFDNDNIKINGELKCVENFSKYISIFVDIGANEGIFSKELRKINPSINIIIFEPNPNLVLKLKQELYGVTIHQIALSNIKSNGFLYIHPDESGTASLFLRKYMMPNYVNKMLKTPVKVDCLDNFKTKILKNGIKSGIYIKIDAEGAEFPIIEGSKDILSIDGIIFVHFEYSFAWKESNNTLMDAFHFLNMLDFQLYRITPLGLEKIKFYSMYLEDYRYCNYLAIKNFNLNSTIFKKHIVSSRDGDTFFYEFL